MTETIVSTYMRTMGLDEDTIARVRTHRPLLETRIDGLVDRYFAHLRTLDLGLPPLEGDRAVSLRAIRVAHWKQLLDADFAGVWTDYAENIGRRAIESRLPPKVLLVAAEWFHLDLAREIGDAPEIAPDDRIALIIALGRFAYLDLALAQAAIGMTWID
ncbi:hypothetical protein EYW49_09760 [Siculibacillus lacustris]|uniref:Globin-sensor domain-containing protein n=1 Tax=Siculibacillus lacustris TaxID=1549641 RepID=A0A4Q9VRH9_9HYPH|nr:protoglobin domain-containing protein [Siculibacillus lacustris]TBW38224.1 hypothetical protein EYW49_09760 [Siculibacillus lacustris]